MQIKMFFLKKMRYFKILFALVMAVVASNTVRGALNDVFINEIMVINNDQFIDPSWNYGSWIELYNSSVVPCQLKNCWLSDDPNDLKKVHITQSTLLFGHSFMNMWFGHHDIHCLSQMDMKLDVDGGVLYFSDPVGNLLFSQDYPMAIPRSSWCRIFDGAQEWCYTSTPSPESSNNKQTVCVERLPAPEISQPSTIFDVPFSFQIPIPEGVCLRYTTDGSFPSRKEGKISETGVFDVSKSVIYRFAFYRDGYMTSPVVTRTFLKNDKKFSLPVISVVSAPDNLYSDKMGIFVQGTNGCQGYGSSSKANWNRDWDRPANFEYFSEDGISRVNQETELFRSGGYSRWNTPYTFKIHASKSYEMQNSLNYPFFKDKPYLKHKTLLFRNGGNDCNCRVKDAFLQKLLLTSGMDVDAQDYQPVAHYINGVYKGTINMREPNNKHFVYANYGLDEDEIDMLEIDVDSGYVQKCGTKQAFERLYELSKSAQNRSVYQEIENLLDIDEFCNYTAVEFFLGNTYDWPRNNMKAWRPRVEGGKFRYILYDLDLAFNTENPFPVFESMNVHTFNVLYDHNQTRRTMEIQTITIFLNLLKNDSFRRHFIDAFSLVAGSVFLPSRCSELIKEWAAYVYPMQVLNDNGYNRNSSPWSTANNLIAQLENRAKKLHTSLQSYSPMKLEKVSPNKLKIKSNVPEAKLMYNNQHVPLDFFDGLSYYPVTLKAEAPSGYVFDGWVDMNGDSQDILYITNADEWAYYDQGCLDGKSWWSVGYSISTWQSGKAPFCTEKNAHDSNTTLHETPTCYLRKSIKIPQIPRENVLFKLAFQVNGGFVLYVNGKEAGRYYMSENDANHMASALSRKQGKIKSGVIDIEKSFFKKGINVIAVELHGNDTNENGIYWDSSLFQTIPEGEMVFLSTNPEVTLPPKDLEILAHFSKEKENLSEKWHPVINEISASNSIYVNDFLKKSDWIEIYNNSEDTFDLAGCFLSDDLMNPFKYEILSSDQNVNTILLPHSFMIIWCDGSMQGGQIHAPFKLVNSDNNHVLLSDPNGLWTDTLAYCHHDGRESVGRYPDGSANVYRMYRPSIGKTNMMNMYSIPWRGDDGNSVNENQSVWEGDMSFIYRDGNLLLKKEDMGDVVLTVYTIEGVKVMSQSVEMEQPHIKVSLERLNSGIYIATMSDNKNRLLSIKFTIKRK